MGRPALDVHLEASDPLASGHDLAAVAGGLGHEGEGGTPGEVLDDRPRRRAADLLVRGHEVDERAPGASRAGDLLEGLERKIGAALHVVAAGAVEPVAVEPHGEVVLGGAEGMHRVEVGDDQDCRLVPLGARPQHEGVAEARAAGDALDRDRRLGRVGRDEVHHPVHARRRMGRALGLEPDGQAFEGVAVRGHEGAGFL
jgi:hypothetical protein